MRRHPRHFPSLTGTQVPQRPILNHSLNIASHPLSRASRRRGLLCACLAAAGLAWGPSALAQAAYPDRPIRMIVAFAAGSASDAVGRAMAEEMSKQMGVAVTVENIVGAGGNIGHTAAARAQPDGYTLMLGTSLMAMAVHMHVPPTYDAVKDFTPVARIGEIPLVAVAPASAPFKTWNELMTYARANPGKVNYATSGKGSSSHVYTEMLKRELKFEAQDVGYKAVTQAVMDTSTHKVDFFIANLPPTQGLLSTGQLRAIAVGSLQRMPALPDVPTFAEVTGRRDLQLSLWYGVFAPSGTPKAAIARLEKEAMKAAESPTVKSRLATAGGSVSAGTASDLERLVRDDNQAFSSLIKSLGLAK